MHGWCLRVVLQLTCRCKIVRFSIQAGGTCLLSLIRNIQPSGAGGSKFEFIFSVRSILDELQLGGKQVIYIRDTCPGGTYLLWLATHYSCIKREVSHYIVELLNYTDLCHSLRTLHFDLTTSQKSEFNTVWQME